MEEVNHRKGTPVVLRNLPPHRARFEGSSGKIMQGREVRRHKMWKGDHQDYCVGYIVEVDSPDQWWPSEFRVPAVCVYLKEDDHV